MIGAAILGAAFGLSATDDINDSVPARIQPVQQKPHSTTIQYDPPGGYCEQHGFNICEEGPPDPYINVTPTTTPPNDYLCEEDPYSHDCWMRKQEQWAESAGGPVVLR